MGTSLVTGVNGHLLPNLVVRELAARGETVRALVLSAERPHPCERLPGCRVFYTDDLHGTGIEAALAGVETLYHATYLLQNGPRRAGDAERRTIERTRAVLTAAARQGVARVVLVSCSVAIDPRAAGGWSAATWNPAPAGLYERARVGAERLAWELAAEGGLSMTSVLPTKMIGPFRFGRHTTGSMGLLEGALFPRRFPPALDDGELHNWVDVRQVARATLAAAERGRPGARYLLANPEFLDLGVLHELALELAPNLRPPRRLGPLGRRMLTATVALLTRETPPAPRRTAPSAVEIGPAAEALGFAPGDPRETVREVYRFLWRERRPGSAA
ncbi:MAG TPA: NAD-dependent epimerase/dehydratase family protein [Thermoanaerobaculia bacterium]|jgi:dihydroflavonol-4-reductase|nr:NAD-dependent epimerase/dehydratase family protein [Thermoanaerobaculia bacterium]